MINLSKRNITRLVCCTIAAMFIISLSIKAQCTASHDNQLLDSVRWKPIVINNSCDTVLRTFVHSQPDTIIRNDLLKNVFDTLCYSNRSLKILHIGDSHVAGKSFPNSLKQYLSDSFGLSENDLHGKGISFSYIAKNGATALNFLTPERKAMISTKHPDLVIMSFGTNECHGLGYREDEHLRDLTQAVNIVRELCPGATILLTTPPGDYLSRRVKYYIKGKDGKRYRRYRYKRNLNPMTTRCSALICDYAEKNNIPVWNLNSIAGGEHAVRNWQNHKMMRKDFIHFLPEGYNFHARMLNEAIVKSFNAYIDRQDSVSVIK